MLAVKQKRKHNFNIIRYISKFVSHPPATLIRPYGCSDGGFDGGESPRKRLAGPILSRAIKINVASDSVVVVIISDRCK